MSSPASPLLPLVSASAIRSRRGCVVDERTLDEVGEILADITARGDAAVMDHARRLGDLSEPNARVVYSHADLEEALGRIDDQDRRLLERAADRIRGFALAQRACLTDLSYPIDGGRAGHTCLPVHSVGCYAPGGRFPLPSSVLMTAVTARAAGVENVWVASPRPALATLAAAAIAGADGLLAIGGAQAIAAMARGLVGCPRCDMIVGPGNRWVTAAKLLLSGEVGIDMLAGPSELVVLADDAANPTLIAADLIAQAEHDEDALPVLITTDTDLIARVRLELDRQLEGLATAPTAKVALSRGMAVLAGDVEEAIRISDRLGPEHLSIHMRDAGCVAGQVRNAGAIFIGGDAAEVLGDYAAGPNHVLPTGGSSRYRAGLSVFSFLRARTWLSVDDARSAGRLYQDAAALGRIEGLEGHARSAAVRLDSAPRCSLRTGPV